MALAGNLVKIFYGFLIPLEINPEFWGKLAHSVAPLRQNGEKSFPLFAVQWGQIDAG
jgi:hypothetical protein